MLISIAMATYNGEKYLREQIDSILNQTIQDFELIVCDDCSKDSTVQILKEYEKKDSRIKVFVNKKNLGFKKNFEKAISLCSGKYIALSDQDDVWLLNHLEFLMNNLGEASFSCANSVLVDKNNHEIGKNLNIGDSFCFMPPKEKVLWKIMFSSSPFQGASSLYKAEFLKTCIPIPEEIKFHDAWFAANACMQDGINYSFDVISRYRQHGNNVTSSGHQSDVKNSSSNILKKIVTFSKIIFGKYKKSYTDRFYYAHELYARYGNKNMEFNQIYKIMKELKLGGGIVSMLSIWKNYSYIKTSAKKEHKGFLRSYLKYSKLWTEKK